MTESLSGREERLVSAGSRARYVGVRALQMLPTLFLILLAAFALLHLAPGDAAQALAGEGGGGDAAYLELIRRNFGLDQPLYIQFLRYVQNVLSGELGFSFRNNSTVAALIGAKIVPTLLLTGSALVLAVLLGVLGGVVAALKEGRWPDVVISTFGLLLYATPGFLLGIGLMILFGSMLSLLPTGGFSDVSGLSSRADYVASVAAHLVLPSVTLGTLYAAIYMRFTRGAVLETRGMDYVRTARAKGISRSRLVMRHILRNALLPLVTMIGLQAGSLLSGAILVETVFAWPGLGRLAFEAVQQRDYNLLAGLVLTTGTTVVLVNLAVDLVYMLLDPRVKLR